MAEISTTDVVKLRKSTGAGIMDCRNALREADGDFEKAVEIIRKKGKLVASKRADREANEGVVLSRTSDDLSRGVMIVLNCETDFVILWPKMLIFCILQNPFFGLHLNDNQKILKILKIFI